jgi:hypothetical protein
MKETVVNVLDSLHTVLNTEVIMRDSMNMNVVKMETIGMVKHIKVSLLYGVLNFTHQLK